jgi:DNA-binding transcriptional MerR regulator
MRIGEVHALLRQDHPDIELSKIRYYEDKGLVKPSRSRKGYRLYSERDVDCLREAIRLAQEEFVPLRVVRVRLVEQGLLDDDVPVPATRQVARESAVASVIVPAPTNATPLRVVPAPAEDAPIAARVDEPTHVRVNEFLARSEADPAVVNLLVSLGLLSPTNHSGETVFRVADVAVVAAAGRLMARGVDPRFLGALRRITERELGVIEDLTEPLRAPGRKVSPEESRRLVREVAGEVEALRALLMERTLATHLGE